jgi:membrane protease YdiL (CAAX protease family)
LTTEFASYAARGRNAGWRYLATTVLALGLAIALGVAVLLPLQLAGVLPPDLTVQIQHPREPVVFFSATGVIFGCLLGGFVLAARWVQAKRFGDIVGAWRWSLFARGALVWGLVLVLSVAVDALFDPSGFRLTAGPGTPALAFYALLALVPQTFAEEFVFRGLLTQGLLLAFRRPAPAAVVSGLMFGALHIPNGLPQAVSATVFGIVTAMIAIRLGGIAFTSGLHAVNNLMGAVVVVSADDVFRGLPGVFTQATPQLMWWDVAMSSIGLTALTIVVFKSSTGQPSGADGR